MRFLAKRFAVKGGTYFLQESKQAVSLLGHSPQILPDKAYCVVAKAVTASVEGRPSPDVLADGSSSSNAELNSLRADLSLPPVTFGPKRWELPEAECSDSVTPPDELRQDLYDEPTVTPSDELRQDLHDEPTVTPSDELRQDLYDEPMDPETLKAAAEGLAYVWKAFGIATAIVFSAACLIFGIVATKLEIHSRDDIRVKGRDFIQRKLKMIREQLVPLNKRSMRAQENHYFALTKAENLSRGCRGAEIAEQNPTVKEVSEALGAKPS